MTYCELKYENPNDIVNKICVNCGRKIANNHTIERSFFICKLNKKKELNMSPPKMPPITTRIFNFLNAVKDFIEDPTFVSKEQYEERLQICDGCDDRIDNSCRKCGCNLSIKAKGKAFHCPEKKWPGDI